MSAKEILFTLKLEDGSVLVMHGTDTQTETEHSIPKERFPSGKRLNITFRHHST